MGNRSRSPRNDTSQRNRYRQKLRALSDRLVEAQRPIRILDAIKWDESVERAFFARDGRELPPISPGYYSSRPLPFDPDAKIEELHGIERDVLRQLGEADAPGDILARMCQEYRSAVWMLARRGTPAFGKMSAQLYGSAGDCCHDGVTSLADLGRRMSFSLPRLLVHTPVKRQTETLDARRAVEILAARLQFHFRTATRIRVRLSDGILADAAAGCAYIKLRGDAHFTAHNLRLLEVHEGWVHLGTTLNGQSQPICTFLGKGPPSSSITQEGLAVLTEVLASASSPQRLRRLCHRVEGVALAEDGGDFLDVYRFFLGAGYDRRDSYHCAARIFRGSLPAECGPFTKDLCYCKGLGMVADYLRGAIRKGKAAQIPLLFCGKTTLADLPALERLVEEGLVVAPRFVPPPFTDVSSMSAWKGLARCFGNAASACEPRVGRPVRRAIQVNPQALL
jgi:uncharacterized protein (TIGR02421 family)